MVRCCTYLGKNMTSVVDAEYESFYFCNYTFLISICSLPAIRSHGQIGKESKTMWPHFIEM